MSSLIYLGLSVIAFIITYGIAFLVLAAVLGVSFSAMAQVPISDPKWAAMFTRTNSELQFLVPLAPALGIFMLVIKVLMSSSVRGRD